MGEAKIKEEKHETDDMWSWILRDAKLTMDDMIHMARDLRIKKAIDHDQLES